MIGERIPSKESRQSNESVFDAVAQFLREEQSTFGDVLITGSPQSLKDPAMPRPHPPLPEDTEPSLFGETTLPAPAITSEPWGVVPDIQTLNGMICTCMKCPLGATRTRFVFGVGNPSATLMLIGEAPGADEDLQGEPFVGRAGQLLNKILEAIHFKREEVYIANILKCRPPNNRSPQPEEVELCLPYLRKQIDLIKPKLILCLGLVAAQNLLGISDLLSKLRGRVMKFQNIPVMVTYHPAALLRNPNWKRPAWEDVQAARKLHDELMNA